MKRRYFGTDGVRGTYGGPLVNEDFSARLAAGAGRWLSSRGIRSGRILIGRDTRASGESLAAAVARGFRSEGLSPVLLGVVPTPAVSRAVRATGAALGAVITASHNPAGDNGVKFFGPDGRKLTDAQEAEIEGLIPAEAPDPGQAPGIGAQPGVAADYIAACAALLPAGSLAGWRIVLDCANGAGSATSPAVLRLLGADVVGIGDAPDGSNINAGVGSEHVGALCARVRDCGARLGIAHDGDADRCVLCDERGSALDGDEVLAILATHALGRGELARRTLVATVQSNLGLDAAVAAAGGRVVRASVGDRYVIEAMAAEGATLGGEPSGHIIFSEVSPTGDGLAAALKVIEVMLATGKPLSELRCRMTKFPQATAALHVREKKPLAGLGNLGGAIRSLETELGARGRVLVRYSGTEPKIRFLVEGPDAASVRDGLARLVSAAGADLDLV